MKLKKKIAVQNLLLVSGNGRNSGKTLFARRLIAHFSKTIPVTGLKISPHFHWVDNKNILLKKEHFTICEELDITKKDSSIMLQSGADRVFFMMVEQEHLREAFQALMYFMPETIIVCESGGLQEEIVPGLHFFIKEKGSEIIKNTPEEVSPVIVQRTEATFDFDIQNIQCSNNKFTVTNEPV